MEFTGSDKLRTGLPVNTASALAYILGPLSGLFFLVTERHQLVRFHSVQSIFVFVPLFAIQWLLTLHRAFYQLASVFSLVTFILWLVLIYTTWDGKKIEIPVITNLVRKFVK